MPPNENKMSDGGPERASLEVNVWKSFHNVDAQRSAVRSIAWLDVSTVKRFGTVIANATKDLSAKLSFCLASPLSARSLQTRVALAAPSVWARIAWVYRGEESHTATIPKSFDNVLADECLLLRTVLFAVDGGCRETASRNLSDVSFLLHGSPPEVYRRVSLDAVGPSALASGAISHFSWWAQGRAEPPRSSGSSTRRTESR